MFNLNIEEMIFTMKDLDGKQGKLIHTCDVTKDQTTELLSFHDTEENKIYILRHVQTQNDKIKNLEAQLKAADEMVEAIDELSREAIFVGENISKVYEATENFNKIRGKGE